MQGEINSIDEAEFFLSTQLEKDIRPNELGITPEQEFWAHCSNIQAWAEHNYDSRLIHSNLAFPLLKKLSQQQDPAILKQFKQEIKNRLKNADGRLLTYLKNLKYIPYNPRESSCLKKEDIQREDVAEMLEYGKPYVIIYLSEMGFLDLLSREEFYMSLLNWNAKRERQAKCMIKIESLLGYTLDFDLFIDEMVNGFFVENNKITILSLYEEEFPIPSCIGNLTDLRALWLGADKIKELPNSFKNLKKLEYINIASNFLDNLPKELIYMNSLKKCVLSFNNITTIPEDIENLDNIEHLNLENNKISKLPGTIGKLKKLEYLNLDCNNLTDLPEEIGELTSLKYLNLSNNKLETLPKTLINLNKLETLQMRNNNFTKIPHYIQKMKNVKVSF